MYSLEDIFKQAQSKRSSSVFVLENGVACLGLGVKMQKFNNCAIEVLNCSRGKNHYDSVTAEELKIFLKRGWTAGCYNVNKNNYRRKIDLVEVSIRNDVNTRKNEKYTLSLKIKRERLLVKYSELSKKINNHE